MDNWQKHESSPHISLDQYVRELSLELSESLSGKKAIYLDTNYWVILRDAALGKPRKDADVELLTLLRSEAARQLIFCPLSDTLFIEVMKQSDTATLSETAKLIDALSGGIALRPLPVRGATEIARYIKSLEVEESSLHSLKSLLWTKAPYAFGEQHPDGMPFGRQKNLVLQKAFVDKMWRTPFSAMVEQLIKSDLPEPPEPYERLAGQINSDSAMYAKGLRSFEQAVKDEWQGMADFLAGEAADYEMDVMYDDASQRNTPEWIASEEKWRARLYDLRSHPNLAQVLPTAFTHARLHASVRWDKLRQLKPHDFPDFQHASAALPYCDAFFTDGPMCHLLKDKRLGFSDSYSCKVASTTDEAISILESLLSDDGADSPGVEGGWREERISAIKESIQMLGNEGKDEREKWVTQRLLDGLKIDYREEELIVSGDEPCDVAFRDARFQVKEIMDKGRRRSDEYKKSLENAENAESESDLLESYTPKDISFSEAVEQCRSYAASLLTKYGIREIGQIDLLCYFNKQDHQINASSDLNLGPLPFRSLSVVAGGFCSVVYAHGDAPELLRQHAGIVNSVQ